MNRSALVIKMLNYLYANARRHPVSREELAQVLETNPRNILEFKKELEIAGYAIDSIRGKDGGYLLNEEGIFPSLALDEEEKEAINKVVDYLKRQSNFDEIMAFESAMNKLKARITNTNKERTTIYLEENRTRLNEQEKEMLNILQEAKRLQKEVKLQYSKGIKEGFEQRKLQPYEIIVNSDGYYVLAEDITPKKEHRMKLFKIIEERMQEVEMLSHRFIRDEDFKVSSYVGEYALMNDLHEVKLKIGGLAARLVNEQEIENTLEKYWKEEYLYIHFLMEGKYRVKRFVLSLGAQCEVLSPSSLREEILEENEKLLALYKKSAV